MKARGEGRGEQEEMNEEEKGRQEREEVPKDFQTRLCQDGLSSIVNICYERHSLQQNENRIEKERRKKRAKEKGRKGGKGG